MRHTLLPLHQTPTAPTPLPTSLSPPLTLLPPPPQYFTVSMQDACRALELGLTVLKRLCRHYGISRWPYRKFASLDRLVADMKEQGRQNPDHVYVALVQQLELKRWVGLPQPCALQQGLQQGQLCCALQLSLPHVGSDAHQQPYASSHTTAAASTCMSPPALPCSTS